MKWTVSGVTTSGQSGPESDGNKEVLLIPESFGITGASPSECLASYLGHSLQKSYPSAWDAVDVFCSPSRLGHISYFRNANITAYIVKMFRTFNNHSWGTLSKAILGFLYLNRQISIFPLGIESKAFVKLTNNIVAGRFFARAPSRILRIVKICDVEDLFLRNPFWFFLRMLSILGSMRLR